MDQPAFLSNMVEKLQLFNIAIDPVLIWIVVGVSLIIFAILTVVIFYHWTSYSYAPKTVGRVTSIYIIGSALIILVMCASALHYTVSVW